MKLLVVLFLSTVLVAHSQDFICNMCTELIQSLEQEITKDEPDIIGQANALCDKITNKNPILDPLCKQLIDSEIESVIDDLKNQDPPKEVCQKMGLCGK